MLKNSNVLIQILLGTILNPLRVVDGEGGEGDDAPAESVDWNALNEGIEPGADEDGSGLDPEPDAEVKAKSQEGVRKLEGKPATAKAPAKAKEKDEEETPDEGTEEEAETSSEETTPEEEQEGETEETAEEETEEEAGEEEGAAVEAKEETAEEKAARLKAYQEWEKSELARLEKVYEPSEEDVAAFQTEPEKVLARMAAKLHMELSRAMTVQQHAQVPYLLQQARAAEAAEKKAEEFFFQQNPDLKDLGVRDQILKVGAVYRQLNPKAKPEEAAKAIGDIIRGSIGKGKPAQKGSGKPSSAPAKKPAKPHKPLTGSGSRPAPGKPGKAEDSWADMAGERGT